MDKFADLMTNKVDLLMYKRALITLLNIRKRITAEIDQEIENIEIKIKAINDDD